MNDLIGKLDSTLTEVKVLRQTGKYVDALGLLPPFIHELEALLEDFNSRVHDLDRDERKEMIKIAEKLADCYGICGGLARRRGKEYLKDSLKFYELGRDIELNTQYRIFNSYNLVNAILLKILIKPEQIYTPELKSEIEQARAIVERQVRGERQDQWWAWADFGLLNLLVGKTEEAERAYHRFWATGARDSDFASSRVILKECAEALMDHDNSLANSISKMIDKIIEIKPIRQ
jgi:hypothetical protein